MKSNVINFDPNLNIYLPVNSRTHEIDYTDKIFSLINNQKTCLERLKKAIRVNNHLNGIIKKENKIIKGHEDRIAQIAEDIDSLDTIIRESDSKTHKELENLVKEFGWKHKKLNLSQLNAYDKGSSVNALRTIKDTLTNRKKELSAYLSEHQRRLNICEGASAYCQGIIGLLQSGKTPHGMVDRTPPQKKTQASLAKNKNGFFDKKPPVKKKPGPPKDDNFEFQTFHERDRDTGEKITGYTNWNRDYSQIKAEENANDLWTEDGAVYAKGEDGEPVRVRSAKEGIVQDALTGVSALNHKQDESASAPSVIFDTEADEWVSLEKYAERQASRKQSKKENMWAENYGKHKIIYDGWIKYIYNDTKELEPDAQIYEEFIRLKTAYDSKVPAIYLSADKRIEIKISNGKLTACEVDVKGNILKTTEYLIHTEKVKFAL